MSKQIAGFITEWDQNGRLRITLPAVRGEGVDALNTEAQLRAFASKREGWSPLKKKSYLAKPATGKNGALTCFAYDSRGRRVNNFDELVHHSAVLEVDFLPFVGGDQGWWIRVASIRLVD
jgi:hypothetical protein